MELGRAGVPLEVMQAVHELKNWEIRQAAINAGIDLGQKHVGSRADLGPEQIPRQELIDQMIRQGVKPERIPELAKMRQIPYQRIQPMPKRWIMPEELAHGIKTGLDLARKIIHHELGHAIVAVFRGMKVGEIISYLHQESGVGSRMATEVNLRDWLNAEGKFDKAKILANPEPIIDLSVAGAAVNQWIDGLRHTENPGVQGDQLQAIEAFNAMELPEPWMHKAWDAGVDRVIAELSAIPGLEELIRLEAGRREENLPVQLVMTEERVNRITQRALELRDARDAAIRQRQQELFPEQAGVGNAPGVPAPGGGSNPPNVAGREGPIAPAGAGVPSPKGLKPYTRPKIVATFELEDFSGRVRQVEIPSVDKRDAEKQIRAIPGWRTAKLVDVKFPPVEYIPDAIKGTRPLEPMRDPAEAREAAAEKEGERDRDMPRNPLTILEKDGVRYAFGGMAQAPIGKAADIALEKQQKFVGGDLKDWRNWYPNMRQLFNDQWGRGAGRRAGGWAMTQRGTSPARGMQNMARVEDLIQGLGSEKTAGIGRGQVESMLRGQTPEGGVGAKLHDFVDSMAGVLTRTWMGQDPRGLQPVAGDVWSARAAGYVDKETVNFIRKNWGDEVANKFQVDLHGAPTRFQYERINEFYNALKDEYNRRGIDGGNWTAPEVQSTDWGATGRSFGRDMDLPQALWDKNISRVAYEVRPSTTAPYNKLYGSPFEQLSPRDQTAVTRAVNEPLLRMLKRETGGYQVQHFYGPGGYLGKITPSPVLDVFGSPEVAERVANMVGYLLQQDEVWYSRPLYSGEGHFLQVIEGEESRLLLDHQNVVRFWDLFRRNFPPAQGFQPVRINGAPGLRVLASDNHMGLTTSRGEEVREQLESAGAAAKIAGQALGIEKVYVLHGGADVRIAKNDWQVNPRGNQYLARLTRLGEPGLLHRLRAEYVPEIREILKGYFGK